MNSLYITELGKDKENIDNKKSRSLERTPTKSRKKQHGKLEKVKEHFLDFLIHEETRFADLEKIEEHYKELSIMQFTRFNINKSTIDKKLEDLNEVTKSIEQELLDHYIIRQEDLLLYYRNAIIEVQQQIKIKEHDLECYQHMYDRLYESNYLIEKRLDEELNYEILNDQHFKKYEIIKSHALLTLKQQKARLTDMNTYQGLSSIKHDTEVAQKKNKFKELEYQVFMIKKDTVDVENMLDKLKNDNMNLHQVIREVQMKNEKINEDKIGTMKDYLKLKTQLWLIYKRLKVKNPYQVILKFNDQKARFQSLNSQFGNVNKVIAELNNLLTTLQKELNGINLAITTKISLEYSQDSNPNIVTLSVDIQKCKAISTSLKEKCENIGRIVTEIFKFLQLFNAKLLASITSSPLYRSLHVVKKPLKYFFNINNIITSDVVQYLCMLFQEFSSNLFSLFYLVINRISEDISCDPYFPQLGKKTLINIFDQVMISLFEENSLKAMESLQNKIEIFSRSDRDIFKDRKVTKVDLNG